MMTYTAYDPETLEQWCSDKTNFQLFDSALQDYLQIFSDQFHAKSQKKYFSTLIKGFFSPLDRKSLEPIALQLLSLIHILHRRLPPFWFWVQKTAS